MTFPASFPAMRIAQSRSLKQECLEQGWLLYFLDHSELDAT